MGNKIQICKRQGEGLVWGWIAKQALEKNGKKRSDIEEIISELENYKFVKRKETDPSPHRNSKPLYIENLPQESSPKDIVRAIIIIGESLFNAKKANSLKKYCIEYLKMLKQDYQNL